MGDVADEAEVAEDGPQLGGGDPRRGRRLDGVEDAGAGLDVLVLLGVVAEGDVGAEADTAGVVGVDAGQAAQQRRLAGAVGPDDEEDLAPPDGELHLAQDGLVAEALGEPVDGQHHVARPHRVGEPHPELAPLDR